MTLTAATTLAATTYADLEAIADRQIVKLGNERFSRKTSAAIAPVRHETIIGKDRFPAISSVAAIAVLASGSVRARDWLAVIEPTATTTTSSVATTRLPSSLFAFDTCRPAATATLAATRTENGQTFDTE